MLRTQIASVLVAVAVALAMVCSTGVAVMEDALQRLHFSAAVTSFSTGLIVAAVWLDDPNWQARLKALLIAVVLFVMNSVLSHSTARAIRVLNRNSSILSLIPNLNLNLIRLQGHKASPMDLLQFVVLVLVMTSGTVVVLTRDVTSQSIVVSIFGLILTVMLQGSPRPNVTFSQIV